ncbi:MAG: signal peptidase I [Bacteroidota bacterium]
MIIFFAASVIGQYKLFEKAGQPGWAAIVPFYSSFVMLKITGKPIWWIVLFFLPIVNVLVSVALTIEFAKSYGKYKLKEHAAALLLPFYYYPKIGFDQETQYLGPPDSHKSVPVKSGMREWGDAILFAGVAALVIRTFFIEAFMIPTSSMERTLLAGDFLFVSKFQYGSRMPMIPLSVPFIHNKISLFGATTPSYTDAIKLPYFRFPGLSKVERGDIVVFNYPAHDIHDLGDGAGFVEPISMKENYIKRCVAVAGDTISIVNQQVHIDGVASENPPNMQMEYIVSTNQSGLTGKRVREKLHEMGFRQGPENVKRRQGNWNYADFRNAAFTFLMNGGIKEQVLALPSVQKADSVNQPVGARVRTIYPFFRGKTFPPALNEDANNLFAHNHDNFLPIWIPKKGETIQLNTKNLIQYWRVIDIYEEKDIELKNGKVLIEGQETDSYTFEQDYYFMMGDNRHNSEDSRFWGFVPENHVVGTPLLVFFSYESEFGIRWSRIGRKYVH